MGFIETLRFFLIHILFAILGGVLSALWIYLLLAHGIPWLLGV